MSSILYYCCLNGDIEGARAALTRGEDASQIWQHGDCDNPLCDKNPNCDFKASALHGAIKGGHSDVVALLLQQPGVDVNLDIFGFTPLNMAVMFGRTKIMRQLRRFQSEGEKRRAGEKRREKDKKAEEKRAEEEKKKEEERKKEGLSKKEEAKKQIGHGKGRNARRRKKEEERSRQEEKEWSTGHDQGLGDYTVVLEEPSKELELKPTKVSEDPKRSLVKGINYNAVLEEPSKESELKPAVKPKVSEDEKMRSIKEPENRSLLEFMDRQILDLEEELECPVCLEVTTSAPIYKCLDDHLICRLTTHTYLSHNLNIAIAGLVGQNCQSALNAGLLSRVIASPSGKNVDKCPCQIGSSLSYRKFRGAERQAERLLALRMERLTIN